MGSLLSRQRPLPSSPTPSDQLVLPVAQVDHVFQNDLLLDLILTRVLLKPIEDREPNATFSHSEACALRQVCYRWMLTVSALFLRAREPLLHLEVIRTRDPEILQSLMEGFQTSTLYTTGSTSGRLPPFSLSLIESDHLDVAFCFETLMVHIGGASSLVQFEIRANFFSENPLSNVPSNLRFEALHKMTVCYGDYSYPTHYCGYSSAEGFATFVLKPFNVFIQTILDGTLELKSFSYEDDDEEDEDGWTRFVHVLILPQTLTHLQTITGATVGAPTQGIKPVHITSPLQPPLCQLTSLSVQNMSSEYVRDLLKFLCEIRFSLEHLSLEREWEPVDNLHIILTEFPVLPKLKTFNLEGQLILMVGDTETEKEAKCPALQSLALTLADNTHTFRTWTPVPLKTVFQIRSNFPCVVHMTIVTGWGSRNGLRNLFRVMGAQLRALTVQFEEDFVIYDYNDRRRYSLHLRKHDWDALFLGTTQEVLKRHRRRPNKLRKIVNEEKCVQQSIRNLRNLEQFCVSGKYSHYTKVKTRLVSELCFRLGFLEMPQLKHLSVGGSFGVAMSKKSMRLWRRAGGGRTMDIQL